MFGMKFWKQAVIVFTRLKMDAYNVEQRERVNKRTDAQLAADYIKIVGERFPRSKGLRYLIFDACRNAEMKEDNEAFEKGLQTIWCFLESSPKLLTDSVMKVESEHKKLKNYIERMEKEKADKERVRQVDNENM